MYKDNASKLISQGIRIYDIPSYREAIIELFDVKDERIIEKINRSNFDDELKVYFKNFNFASNCKEWAYEFLSKISYLSPKDYLIEKVIIGLYLFYFYIEYPSLYKERVKVYDYRHGNGL